MNYARACRVVAFSAVTPDLGEGEGYGKVAALEHSTKKAIPMRFGDTWRDARQSGDECTVCGWKEGYANPRRQEFPIFL